MIPRFGQHVLSGKTLASWICDDGFVVACYGLMFLPMLLSNNERAAHRLFLWIVIPAALATLTVRLARANRSLRSCAGQLFGEYVKRPSLVLIGVCLYLAALNVATGVNGGPGSEFLSLQIWRSMQIAGFALLTSLLVASSPAFVTRLVGLLALIGATSAAINMEAFIHTLPAWEALHDARLVAVLGMPAYQNSTNISATYAILFVAAVCCLLATRKKWQIAALLCAAVVLLAGVLVTQARSALIAVLVGLGVLATLSNRRARWAVATCAVVTAILLTALPWARDRVFRGASQRPQIWQTFAAKVLEKPLSGYGERQDITIVVDGFQVDQPHNLLLSSQVRGGVVAGIGMLLILVAGTFWTWRFYMRTGQTVPLAILVTMFACGMFDYNLLITRADWPWITFWLPISLAVGAETYMRNSLRGQPALPDDKPPNGTPA